MTPIRSWVARVAGSDAIRPLHGLPAELDLACEGSLWRIQTTYGKAWRPTSSLLNAAWMTGSRSTPVSLSFRLLIGDIHDKPSISFNGTQDDLTALR